MCYRIHQVPGFLGFLTLRDTDFELPHSLLWLLKGEDDEHPQSLSYSQSKDKGWFKVTGLNQNQKPVLHRPVQDFGALIHFVLINCPQCVCLCDWEETEAEITLGREHTHLV